MAKMKCQHYLGIDELSKITTPVSFIKAHR